MSVTVLFHLVGMPNMATQAGHTLTPHTLGNGEFDLFRKMGGVLGLLASQARRVTDKMILAGAEALGDHSPAIRDPAASLLPSVRTIREVALEIAYAVALKAQEEGLAPACEPEALRQEVIESEWIPEFPEYIPYQA